MTLREKIEDLVTNRPDMSDEVFLDELMFIIKEALTTNRS